MKEEARVIEHASVGAGHLRLAPVDGGGPSLAERREAARCALEDLAVMLDPADLLRHAVDAIARCLA